MRLMRKFQWTSCKAGKIWAHWRLVLGTVCVCVCVCVCRPLIQTKPWISWTPISCKGYKGYKDGLQPETLADGNWLVKQNQPVSKIETKSDTNLRSLYESWFRNVLISKSVILWWQVKKGINSELEGANTRRVLKSVYTPDIYGSGRPNNVQDPPAYMPLQYSRSRTHGKG